MEKEIEDIINNSNLYDEIFEYEVLFTEKGFKVISSNNNENKEDDSTIVCWNLSFILEKNNKKFEILIEGSSIADYSYGRWIDNSCPSIDNIEVLEQL